MSPTHSQRFAVIIAVVSQALSAGCGPVANNTTTDSDGDATSATTTDAESTGCGTPPPPSICMTDVDIDPRVTLCAKRSEGECEGPIDPDGGADRCAWVSAQRFALDATTCADAGEVGLCVALEYYGDGCAGASTCGGEIAGEVYSRVTPQCDLEVFQGDYCGYAPIAWETCIWGQEKDEGCALPYPDVGPGLCNCAC